MSFAPLTETTRLQRKEVTPEILYDITRRAERVRRCTKAVGVIGIIGGATFSIGSISLITNLDSQNFGLGMLVWGLFSMSFGSYMIRNANNAYNNFLRKKAREYNFEVTPAPELFVRMV